MLILMLTFNSILYHKPDDNIADDAADHAIAEIDNYTCKELNFLQYFSNL